MSFNLFGVICHVKEIFVSFNLLRVICHVKGDFCVFQLIWSDLSCER